MPDRFDRRGVLAQDARHDCFLEARDDGSQPRPEHEQIAKTDNAAHGFGLEHQEVARLAERVAFHPGAVGPWDAQQGRTDRLDRHVAHDGDAPIARP
jgi:hypothetical protein